MSFRPKQMSYREYQMSRRQKQLVHSLNFILSWMMELNFQHSLLVTRFQSAILEVLLQFVMNCIIERSSLLDLGIVSFIILLSSFALLEKNYLYH